MRETIWATRFDPGSPPAPDLCNVHGYLGDSKGKTDELLKISISNDTKMLTGPDGRPLYSITAEIVPDSSGYWVVPLYPNSEMVPDDSKYIFVLKIGLQEIKRDNIVVPHQDSWELEW